MKQCVIADGTNGIMILLKSNYLINIIDQQWDKNIKVAIHFFNLKDGIIHTTDKTKVEINDEVNIFLS